MDIGAGQRESRQLCAEFARDWLHMHRLSAIFIAVCMVLIAGSIGALLYLAVQLDGRTSAIVGLTALVGMMMLNMLSGRVRDRDDVGDQIGDLSRGTSDLARQVAEISRRLGAMESRVDKTVNSARGAADPIAAEIGELGTLVRQIADTVASHAVALQQQGATPGAAPRYDAAHGAAADDALTLSESDAVGGSRFRSLSRDAIVEVIGKAVDANRIDLYLQPIVTLPQRKVRYYEALSRLRTEDGDVITAGDFIEYAESVGMMPKIDNLLLFRCVQVTRRLQLKSRDVGLFCNVSASTLCDPTFFRQFLDFMDANRALANALMFEFTQSAYRAFGPIEHESLAALSERGFRFSMDHVTDLRMEPKELADRSFRFLKVPAKLLLNPAASAQSDIHPGDLADLLARSGVDLIAERIESESMVIDLLDFDVRFGQGFLFSPPRPVRVEALQAAAADAPKPAQEAASELAAAGNG
jgi:cyclic-di-GMP phosphodiesterase TipF (flagellum assembly factor)